MRLNMGKASIFLIGYLCATVHARSPLGYDTVLVLVIIELSFAFAVGLSCVIFSINIIRALHSSSEVYELPTGDLPPSRKPSQSTGFVVTATPGISTTVNPAAGSGLQYRTFGDEGGDEYEIELEIDSTAAGIRPAAQGGLWPLLQSFADYLRLW
jgi:hypothetical protein